MSPTHFTSHIFNNFVLEKPNTSSTSTDQIINLTSIFFCCLLARQLLQLIPKHNKILKDLLIYIFIRHKTDIRLLRSYAYTPTLHVYILETRRLSLECRKQIDTTIILFSRKQVFGNFDMDMSYKSVDCCGSHPPCIAIISGTGTRRTSECVLNVDVAGYQNAYLYGLNRPDDHNTIISIHRCEKLQ